MFLSHRAWRHAYAAAIWQHACADASNAPASNDMPARKDLRHLMFTSSSGPMFGVRRPLRHLAWKLKLSEAQIRDIVDVLDRLKTAYSQAQLDRDRSTSDVAAVFTAIEFDSERVRSALSARTRASEVLNQELLDAVRRIFTLLDEEQRREFAYLLRSGAFVL